MNFFKLSLLFLSAMLVMHLDSHINAEDFPNHLEPLNTYDLRDNYNQVVFNVLVNDRNDSNFVNAWMIVKPSFRPEYAIILRNKIINNKRSNDYELEYVIAEEKIWHLIDNGVGRQMDLDLRENVKVNQTIANYPIDVANELIDSWTSVVKQTRYSETSWIGFDGTSYEFFVSPDFFGGTWSPKADIPKGMVESGELLIKYVQAEKHERDKILQKLSKLIKDKLSEVE